jgi:hypothetical protein
MDRRRAVLLWVGDHERAGADFRLRDIYAELVAEGGLFLDQTVLLDAIRDLEGSGHLRQTTELTSETLQPLRLTDRGRDRYQQLRASTVRRAAGWVGGQSLTILVAAVTAFVVAVATTIGTKLVERWWFPAN